MRHLLNILSLFTCKVFALQFGFTLKNTDFSLLNQRFIAFGTIPQGTSSKFQSEMRDFMNTYLQEELRKREFEGIDRQSFIAEPQIMTAMRDGRTLLGLKGELSTFLKLFRYSAKRIGTINKATLKNAVFFSEPIVILSLNEAGKFTRDFEVTLDDFLFIEDESDEIYSAIVRSEDSMASSEGEEIPLSEPAKKKKINENNSEKCCCLCS